jgi:hypothetical protein
MWWLLAIDMVAGFAMFREAEGIDGDPVLEIGGVGGGTYCTGVVVCEGSGVCNIVNRGGTNVTDVGEVIVSSWGATLVFELTCPGNKQRGLL